MADVSSAWKDAGDRLAALGSSLKAHFDERHDGEGEKATADAAEKLKGAVQDAFDAIGAAAKDPGVKDDVRRVGQSLAGALSATFAEVSKDLRTVADKAAPGPTSAKPGGEAGTEPGREPGTEASTEPSTEASAEPGTDGEEPPKVEPWGTP